jgi:hypothetical protein
MTLLLIRVNKIKKRMGDTIKMVTTEAGYDKVVWIYLAQDRMQWRACEHGNEPSSSTKCREVFDYLSNYFRIKKDFASCSISFIGFLPCLRAYLVKESEVFTVVNIKNRDACMIFSALKKEVAGSFETVVPVYQTAEC